MQSSASAVDKGLDLWLATVLQSGGAPRQVPWHRASDMYSTIDSIAFGPLDWKAVKFKYDGRMPRDPPKWMQQTYELLVRDIRALLHYQISSTEFDGMFEYTPYEQYDPQDNRVLSNLMSGTWSWSQAVSANKNLRQS